MAQDNCMGVHWPGTFYVLAALTYPSSIVFMRMVCMQIACFDVAGGSSLSQAILIIT
jgi:hypothetical protein